MVATSAPGIKIDGLMASFRRTALWTVSTSALLWLALTGAGLAFMAGHDNAIASDILRENRWDIASVYGRILAGYLLSGLVAAAVLHPFVRGGKAAFATLGLYVLGFVYVLTNETHLLYGPTQRIYCGVHDAIPAWIRDLYRPWLLVAGFGLLAAAALVRWTRRIPLRFRAGGALLACGAFAWNLLPPSIPPAQGTCVLLVASDSLRADHLSCNGYPRQTSPHIDALAARGTNFGNCLVPTASTHESWISILTATEPRVHGLRHMFPSREEVERLEREQVFLPALLRGRGYATSAVGGWCGTTFQLFDAGFDHVDVSNAQNDRALIAEAAFTNHLVAAAFLDNPAGRLLVPELDGVSFTRSAAAISRRARREIDRMAASGKPFFLTVVFHTTHLPYSSTWPYYALFSDPAYRGRNRYRIDFRIDDMIKRGFSHDLTAEERQHIVDLYDGCVAEFDAQVGDLVAHLRARGLLDRTIVGVLGDHGDDLYEPGCTLGHGVTLFGGDHANHIPAVFAGPGVPRRHVDALVRSFDLAPTWMRWLGMEAPARWQGVDLSGEVPPLTALLETSFLLYRQPVPDLRPGEHVKEFPRFDRAVHVDRSFGGNLVLDPALRERLIETKCFAVREGPWKLIRVPGEAGPIDRLYNLDEDPHGTRDLATTRKAEYERLLGLLPPEAR